MELGEPEPFSFERLIGIARERAQQPYERRTPVAEQLSDLSPEQFRTIRQRADRTLTLGQSRYSLQLFHLGSYHRLPVRISLVQDGLAREIVYDPELFDFGSLTLPELPPKGAGFAGFRVHHPVQDGDQPDELLTFLGASYFRAVARGTQFGISARGLALETGLGRAEEFPAFTNFWIFQPSDPLDPLQICALLDSPSVAGAYRFDVSPRDATAVAVDASLFFRSEITQVGIAPLTSMFFFGPNDRLGIDDHRLRVHDSDGLSIWRGVGEVLWRPLVNPQQLRISVFGDDNPRGFGLLQRERAPGGYGDLDARYERRPNLWVEPKGAWGKGSVRLIEIPVLEETHDNIVAFWTPDEPVTAGRELRLAYTLFWSLSEPIETGLRKVIDTRIGRGGTPGSDDRPDNLRRVVIEFSDQPAEAGAAADAEALPEVVLECHNGECSLPKVRSNEATGGWQVSFDIRAGDAAVELRCYLSRDGKPISEIWLYRLDNS